MADLIDRQAVLREMLDPKYTWEDYDEMENLLGYIPAVDAVEVVHGYWDASGRYRFPSGAIACRCSECGCALSISEYRVYNWNYCPVCGAKMDGERREENA